MLHTWEQKDGDGPFPLMSGHLSPRRGALKEKRPFPGEKRPQGKRSAGRSTRRVRLWASLFFCSSSPRIVTEFPLCDRLCV